MIVIEFKIWLAPSLLLHHRLYVSDEYGLAPRAVPSQASGVVPSLLISIPSRSHSRNALDDSDDTNTSYGVLEDVLGIETYIWGILEEVLYIDIYWGILEDALYVYTFCGTLEICFIYKYTF